MMKTIGVLGGIGPQATMDFEQRFHRMAQQLIPLQGNSSYPPLLVYYHRRPPFAVDATNRPQLPLQAAPQLVEAARTLGQLADFLVITANGAHMVQAALEKAAGRPILSMIDLTVAEVVRRGWRRVGVLGYTGAHVYIEPLVARNIDWQTISADLQIDLDQAIKAVMEGRNNAQSVEAAQRAVEALRSQSVDGIILGCTEIPLLLHAQLEDRDLLNPMEFLVEAAIRRAMRDANGLSAGDHYIESFIFTRSQIRRNP